MGHATVRPLGVVLGCLLSLIVPPPASGDGGLVMPFGRDIVEPNQLAIIVYDQDSQQEDLILQTDFFGDTKDFGWIVPVPALPTLAPADRDIFWDCARLTKPIWRDRGSGWDCNGEERLATPQPAQDGGINIYDEQTVGIYTTITFDADSAPVLADSLEAWGYLHQENRTTVEEALQFYIDKSWLFVAMRIDSTSVEAPSYDGYWYGGIDPVRLTFTSPEVVYPMRISAISAADLTEVLLYVCAPHRMTFTGAEAEYANALSDSELDHLQADYPHLGQVLGEPCFLTKLRRNFAPKEMTDDIILERAPTDHEFRQIHYTGIPTSEFLFLALAGVLVTRSRRRAHQD